MLLLKQPTQNRRFFCHGLSGTWCALSIQILLIGRPTVFRCRCSQTLVIHKHTKHKHTLLLHWRQWHHTPCHWAQNHLAVVAARAHVRGAPSVLPRARLEWSMSVMCSCNVPVLWWLHAAQSTWLVWGVYQVNVVVVLSF